MNATLERWAAGGPPTAFTDPQAAIYTLSSAVGGPSAGPELTDALDFVLPAELEAREPPEARGLRRDHVRLLVSTRADDRIVHARFDDLPRFLAPGDLIVVNDSATLPARLSARLAGGGDIALYLSTRLPAALWIVEPREAAVSEGDTLQLPDGGTVRLLTSYPGSSRLWVARLDLPELLIDYLTHWGRPIAYSYVDRDWPMEMYQTVYAAEPGSAEMPSAGRPFSWEVIRRLIDRGVGFARLTLHTGVASLERTERPYEEAYRVPPETVEAVEAARRAGGRVVAVGTTVVRALESAADERGRLHASQGWTDLVITPARGVRVVDSLLTGFHEPRATHLAMLEAIAGRPHLERTYRAAIAERYLWHEFGDLHLIL
ncbi:MAG TPA: S-adenosylmethionine:tRNA ribosyltransferase-isomerase [Dehalococcoidia bacterium]|nr:S-adenosylmethionine:tRNA ribosyltransferase-isomerase [Dehalococcoidia bacterium]